MIRKSILLPLVIFWLVASYLHGQTANPEDVFNPKGWKLPGKALFELSGAEKVSLPGVPREIIAETYDRKLDSADRSTNLPIDNEWRASTPNLRLIDDVYSLTLYRSTDGRIICWQCIRGFVDPNLGELGTVVSNLVCDLDGDGSYESQFETWKLDSEYTELLASLARIKLGLSDESWLVSRMLKSALTQLSNKAP